MSVVNVEKAMELFSTELKNYQNHKKIAGGVVLHLDSLGDTGYYVGTITCYNSKGLKSENAIPFNKFIRIINEVEELISPYQTNGFTGRIVGWNPTHNVREFLYEKKVHRLFFLSEQSILTFLKQYTSNKRTQDRLKEDIDVLVMMG